MRDYRTGYKTGYGQAKADLLLQINEAISLADRALSDRTVIPTAKQRAFICARIDALRWVRAILKAQ